MGVTGGSVRAVAIEDKDILCSHGSVGSKGFQGRRRIRRRWRRGKGRDGIAHDRHAAPGTAEIPDENESGLGCFEGRQQEAAHDELPTQVFAHRTHLTCGRFDRSLVIVEATRGSAVFPPGMRRLVPTAR